MKKITVLCIVLSYAFISCKTSDDKPAEQPLPEPGTEILSVSEPVTEDKLNNFTFSVKVIADSDIAAGVYDVRMTYGPNAGEGKFTMPKGAEHFAPAIRKGTRPYTYIIGFHMPDDTTFYDYFEVSSTNSGGNMRYLKAYTF